MKKKQKKYECECCYNPFALGTATVLVTGASSGIGAETAIQCSRLGAKVIITGRDKTRLKSTYEQLEGSGHKRIFADLTSEDDLIRLVDGCRSLNGVALCAGISKPAPFKLCTKDWFAGTFDVNFTAQMELVRLLLKAKKLFDGGSVVYVSSVAGSRGGTEIGNTMYGASKAATMAAMRHLAREFAPRQMRFNSISAGQVLTPLSERIHAMLMPEKTDADMKKYPLGRFGSTTDIANGIIYLLSPASSWVTGTELVIDGGLTA